MKPHTFRYDYHRALNATISLMVKQALDEDLNSSQLGVDITAQLIPSEQKATAQLICREEGILCGKGWFNEVFKHLDQSLEINWSLSDGEPIQKNQVLCTLSGSTRSILTGERAAMNFLQTLSGTATTTHQYAAELLDSDCRLLDTRKTIPGFRLAQKYAVTCGGGHNHRIGLFDAFLIKENHILACGGISKAIANAREQQSEQPIEVEVENLEELVEAIDNGADVIMLDNFSNQDKVQAVEINNNRSALEASGNITLESLSAVAKTGVDYISVGAITKNIQALDLSLRIIA